jgi:hypothetical protein
LQNFYFQQDEWNQDMRQWYHRYDHCVEISAMMLANLERSFSLEEKDPKKMLTKHHLKVKRDDQKNQ